VEEDNSKKLGTSLKLKEQLKNHVFHTLEKTEPAQQHVPMEKQLERNSPLPESPHSQLLLIFKLKSLPMDQSKPCLQFTKTSLHKLEEFKKKTEMTNSLDNTQLSLSDGEQPQLDNFNGSSKTHGELTGVLTDNSGLVMINAESAQTLLLD